MPVPILDDPVRKAVASALEDAGLDMSEVSLKLGRNHAYLQQFLKRGTPAELPEDFRDGLAAMTGKPASAFRGAGRAAAPRKAPQVPNGRLGGPVDYGRAGSIPVFGQAVGGSDGRFVFNGQRLADVLAPPSLMSVRDAYAVYVSGESMEPRYRSGETAYVHPHLPVKRGDFVVVQIAADDNEAPEGYIKQFISMDERRIRLVQLKLKKFIEFPTSRVVSVHKIVMAGE